MPRPYFVSGRRRRRRSAGVLSIMISASWPRSAQTSTHSAQPLQWTGSMNRPNLAGGRPRLAGTVAVLLGVGELRAQLGGDGAGLLVGRRRSCRWRR